jgi:hypothetical protein
MLQFLAFNCIALAASHTPHMLCDFAQRRATHAHKYRILLPKDTLQVDAGVDLAWD